METFLINIEVKASDSLEEGSSLLIREEVRNKLSHGHSAVSDKYNVYFIFDNYTNIISLSLHMSNYYDGVYNVIN